MKLFILTLTIYWLGSTCYGFLRTELTLTFNPIKTTTAEMLSRRQSHGFNNATKDTADGREDVVRDADAGRHTGGAPIINNASIVQFITTKAWNYWPVERGHLVVDGVPRATRTDYTPDWSGANGVVEEVIRRDRTPDIQALFEDGQNSRKENDDIGSEKVVIDGRQEHNEM